MPFLILFGITSSRILWVRISANPPNNPVSVNVHIISSTGKTELAGIRIMAMVVKGRITSMIAPPAAGGKRNIVIANTM
jgi:hypothetical protein